MAEKIPYMTVAKLQEFVEDNLPKPEEYQAPGFGVSEKMVLDKQREVLRSLCAFVNRHTQVLDTDDIQSLANMIQQGRVSEPVEGGQGEEGKEKN